MITTPIYDFVRAYAESGTSRFHMPGHKGRGPLGCEVLDITEIRGADTLYAPDGIILESQKNAAALFGTAATVYSTEGSSLCIRAMLYLALAYPPAGCTRTILAARNVHHTFISAAALLDFEVAWLWPEPADSLCACRVTPEKLCEALDTLPAPPAAVYITSPDYLGNLAPIRALAEVCHSRGTRLIVDQAHGAYLHYLATPLHAMDLGADLCCDSAHKTLPVLTGGAYLHLSRNTPKAMQTAAPRSMLLFGSTSPSYLILQSLDLCNKALSGDYPTRLAETLQTLAEVRRRLTEAGWQLSESDPLRITLRAPVGLIGYALADLLRTKGAECEYADSECVVLMLTPENTPDSLLHIPQLLGENRKNHAPGTALRIPPAQTACSIREAYLSPNRTSVAPDAAIGRICAGDTVSCPPCVPIVVAGERISREAAEIMSACGISRVEVLS